ncbi:MAG: oxygen-independent coproporphyrinogen III oxidase [Rikenellaceae bacterium]
MQSKLIERYNIPTPRYTSYPSANFFSEEFGEADYRSEIECSNHSEQKNISIYIHIPFCRHLCHYCGCNSQAIGSQEVMERYLSALHSEMEMTLPLLSNERKVAQIHYGGGSPTTLSTTQLKEINQYILSHFQTIEKPEIAIEVHPGYLDLEYWEGLCNAGFTRVSIGVQDFNDKVLEGVRRRGSKEPIEDIVRLLRSRGIEINLDFIYGLPLQSVESFRGSITRAVELSPDRIVTFSYAHVPWVNENMKKLEALGLPSVELKSALFSSAKEILSKSGYKALGLDHFVKEGDELNLAYDNGMLHRNFQGYCTRRTTGQVYGFGNSAISQLDGAYAQNFKDLKDYIERVESGKLPTQKGYKLSEKERVVREFITTLMCNEAVVWSELSLRCGMGIEELQQLLGYSTQRVADFVQDNIIELRGGSGIYITPSGGVFMRNVAARFDPLLQNGSTINKFSKPI